MSSFQEFINREMPRRPVALNDSFVSYDANPNLPAAPADLQGSPAGSFYLEPTAQTLWHKSTAGANTWVPLGGAKNISEEDFEIQIDSGGTNPPPGYRITNQAEADAWGPVATIPGCVAVLPETLKHLATGRLPTGEWQMDAGQLGELDRLRPTWSGFDGFGYFRLEGQDAWQQVAGTPASMAVASATSFVVTLGSDPGLTANAFKAYYLLVLSGTGAGQFKPIRSHNGVTFSVAGGYAPVLDATSVVRIVERTTTLKVNAGEDQVFVNGNITHSKKITIELWALNIVEAGGIGYWYFDNVDACFSVGGGARLVLGGWFSGSTSVTLADCIIDGDGYAFTMIFIQGGIVRTSIGSSAPCAIFGDNTAGQSAIWVGTDGGNGSITTSLVYLFGAQSFDGWSEAYVKLSHSGSTGFIGKTGANLWPLSDQAAGHAVKLTNGAHLGVDDASGMAGSTFKGATNDIALDSTVSDTWTNLDLAADKVLSSTRLSAIMEG